MDGFVLLALAAIAVTVIYRTLYTFRKSKMNRSKGDEIKRKLEQLRKRRDEE